MAAVEIERMLTLVPRLLEIPHKRIWVTYDEEADVLYVNFKKPSRADDSELTDENVIIRYEGEEIVGLTVLNASRREPIRPSAASEPRYPGGRWPAQ